MMDWIEWITSPCIELQLSVEPYTYGAFKSGHVYEESPYEHPSLVVLMTSSFTTGLLKFSALPEPWKYIRNAE